MKRRTVQAIGVFALLLSFVAVLALHATSVDRAQAQTLPPRPSVTPKPAAPTPSPAPSSAGGSASAATGRIAGTVIDLTTGAPAPGIVVAVGATKLTTDANGNYDISGLPPGSYQIVLQLLPEQGIPAQGAIALELGAGATAIQHLGFHSPAAPAAAPVLEPTPVVVPSELPRTAGTSDNLSILFALIGGMVLLGLGIFLLKRTA